MMSKYFKYIIGIIAVCNLMKFTYSSPYIDSYLSSEKYYFDFDEITHYHISIDENRIQKMKKNKASLGVDDKLLLELLCFQKPDSLSDTSFLHRLTEIGFSKHEIDTTQFTKINEIFQVKEVSEVLETFCSPVYRDILIFRKDNKVTGIAKLCFNCSKSILIGSQVNTSLFGQDGDYHLLEKILNSN